MVSAPKKKPTLTPLAQWLLAYIQEHEITLTELARRSGLSSGALRSLVVYPERIPSLETCLRLAEATGRQAKRWRIWPDWRRRQIRIVFTPTAWN